MPRPIHTYLALGDSYTIGEGVPIYESFPYQTVQLLRNEGYFFHAPEIIAKTGWTTDELSAGIAQTMLLPEYDFVSLLIGVNNQYRGRSVDEYATQFEELLKKTMMFAGNNASQVIVVSIPDWGATPFASDRDKNKIEKEIDAYNAVNKSIAGKYQTHYIDITPGTRTSAGNSEMLVADKLHPSGREYHRWAMELSKIIYTQLQRL